MWLLRVRESIVDHMLYVSKCLALPPEHCLCPDLLG